MIDSIALIVDVLVQMIAIDIDVIEYLVNQGADIRIANVKVFITNMNSMFATSN